MQKTGLRPVHIEDALVVVAVTAVRPEAPSTSRLYCRASSQHPGHTHAARDGKRASCRGGRGSGR